MPQLQFTKMHGAGNDFVIIDTRANPVDQPAVLARQMSDRNRGIGADGLILINPSSRADVGMQIYNCDGSRAQMCGNGVRCVSKYAFEHGLSSNNPMRIETDNGVLTLDLQVENERVHRVRVDVGKPGWEPSRMPCTIEGDRVVDHPFFAADRQWCLTCVSFGNPHAVLFVDDVEAVDLPTIGPKIENAPEFPDRVNVHFVQVVDRKHVRITIWERGSCATQACGTGAAAVCAAGAITGRTERSIHAHVPGGDLLLDWADNDHVYLTGPAAEVFSGVWSHTPQPTPGAPALV